MSRLLAGLAHPIVAAPMAGGPSTPRLAAAVSKAGGLGFLGAGYLSADRLAQDVTETRELTAEPFGVNVFVPEADATADPEAVTAYARHLAGEAGRRGAQVGEPTGGDDAYGAKIELLHRDPVAVVSFAFGLPDARVVRGLQERGSEVWVTLTCPEDALAATALGADAIIAQGIEAGGHRGGTDDADEFALLPLLGLLAARTGLPLVAAGGVADGAALAAVLTAGASAAQIGTAFLACAEAGTSPAYRSVLTGATRLAAAQRPDAGFQSDLPRTTITRAFTGRRARGVMNGFIADHEEHAPAGYPQLHQLTSPVRAAARAAGDPDGFNLWAGQSYPLIRSLPAAELIATLVAEADTALAAAARRLRRRGQ